MMRTLFVLCVLAGSAVCSEETHMTVKPKPPDDAPPTSTSQPEEITPERTWKMSKKNFGYAVIAVVVKSLLLIKLALAKLAVLGNISIMLSKLSLILSIVLTLGKYFGGISKMLKLKSLGYDGHSSHHNPAYEDHGGYIT